ncbi:MAG TPA: heme o synthase [Gaiellaceae bacterium]|jgi:protoheme IX farnesyltransferase|nr:heme o synthase [Gaiellaceae bacterium]
MTPGPWLRLLSIASATGVAVVVATGEWGLAHDVVANITLALLAAVVLCARFAHRNRRTLLVASSTALGLFALAGLSALAGAPVALHLTLGAAALVASCVAAAVCARGGEPAPRVSWRDYLTLTKPRIMVLLLLTAAGGMFVGAGGVPPLGLFIATMGGLALACGGASALNHVLDRDIDIHMSRTDKRPVAAGRIPPERALEFGLALSALSFVVLTSFVNVLAALLALAGNLFYVLVYTRWLKRSTPQNIVIGGAAGAVPPLVGWAAATGNLTLPALFLFLIVFFWTPPHFWALALLIRRDYEAARVPMLPVVKGEAETARSIVAYSFVLVGISLLPFLSETLGLFYLGSALVLGLAFVALALVLRRQTTSANARRLFSFSLLYLALLFVAMALDPILL